MEVEPDGTSHTSRPDKTSKVFDPATGETQVRYPNGTREITKRDGTRLNVDANNIITSVTHPDGTSKVYSEQEFKQLLAERKKGAER